MPIDLIPSRAVTFAGPEIDGLAATFRHLPKPVIGRIAHGRLWLDCRCLEADQHEAFRANLNQREG